MSGHAISSERRGGPHQRSERGAVAVEFALVLPLLVMLIFGIVTAGLSYTHSIGLANAVREGARFGATGDMASATWVGDVIDRTRETQFDDNGATKQTTVCLKVIKDGGGGIAWTCDTGAGNAPPEPLDADLPTPDPGKCVVVVAGSRPFKISLLMVDALESDIVRQSVARYERSC